MLVLSRKVGERVIIGKNIVVAVLEVDGGRVKLGFDCPQEIPIQREELQWRIRQDQSAPPADLRPDESRFFVECA